MLKRCSGLLLAVLLALPLGAARAGSAMTIYSELSYVDVVDGQERAFELGAADIVRPLQQQRVDDGELFAWALYRVEYGKADHDYVLIRQAIDFSALEPPRVSEALWKQVHGRASMERRLGAWSDTFSVRERVLYDLRQFYTNLEMPERPWLTLTYVRTRDGRQAEFEDLMSQERALGLREWVASGGAAAFSRYRVVQPGQSGHWHNHVLVAQHSDFSALQPNPSWPEAFARARPGADIEAAMAAFGRTAAVVGTETWRLVDLARRRPPPQDD